MGQAQDGDIDLWDIARLSLLRKQRQPYGPHLIGAQRCIHPKPQIRPAPTDRTLRGSPQAEMHALHAPP